MRRTFLFFLTAIILVGALAALPASASTTTPGVSDFDGTTSADTPTLLITEILINSKTGNAQLDDQMIEDDVATWFSPDAFDYIEIYNAGDTTVNLYDYTIVRANGGKFFSKAEEAEAVAKYTEKMQLGPWLIQQHPDAAGATFGRYDSVVNPAETDADLLPGEFAVIWFYGPGTTALTDVLRTPVGAAEFRKHYSMPEDTLVIAVPGVASNGSSFDLAAGYTYALVHDYYDHFKGVVSDPWGDTPTLNANGELVVCMADYILRNAVGILSDKGMDDLAAYYVPANAKPDVLNKVNWMIAGEGETPVEFNDYVEANFTQSYRSGAILSFTEEPSPGTMPAWQWAYVDPIGESKTVGGVTYTHGLKALSDAAAGSDYEATMKDLVSDWDTNTVIKGADGKLTDAWNTACVDALKAEKANVITGEGNNDEVKIDYAGYLSWVREWTLTDRWEIEDDLNGGSGSGSGTDSNDQSGGGSGTGGNDQSTGEKPKDDKETNTDDEDEIDSWESARQKNQKTLSTGAIIGIVLGAVLLAVICTVVGFIVGYKIVSKKKGNEEK